MKKMKVPMKGEKSAKKTEKTAKKIKTVVKMTDKPRKNDGRTLNELLIEKCVYLKMEGRNGTEYNYRTLLHYIQKHYGMVFMKDVNPAWAADFYNKLVSQNKAAATMRSYFAMLQAVTNYGAYLGLTEGDVKLTRSKSYELDKVKLPKPRTRQGNYFTVSDMDKLWLHWLALGDRPKSHKKWLGVFLASYLCNGCNAVDLVRLRYDDEYYTSGKKVLGFYRWKTRNTSNVYVRIPVVDKLKTIIETIGDEEVRGGLVFGSIMNIMSLTSDEEINNRVTTLNSHIGKVLRRICTELEIRNDVSMTFARHSYASILNNEGCNFAMVEKALGHRLQGVAENYIGNASIERLFDLNSHLFTV